MASHSEIIARWIDVVTGKTDKRVYARGSNVYAEVPYDAHSRDARLYSYGSHFELARVVRPKGRAPFFLLNGDTYSVSTSSHQSGVRSAVAATGWDSVIIPHSAMQSAGIDLDSILPIEVDPERTEKEAHTVTVPGLTALAARVAAGDFAWNRSSDHETAYSLSQSCELVSNGATYRVVAYKREHEYATGTWRDYDPPEMFYYRNGCGLRHIEGDRFEYDSWRHFLGGSLFTAKVNELVTRVVHVGPDGDREYRHPEYEDRYWRSVRYNGHGARVEYRDEVRRTRRAYFLSAFDSNETHPHYFLCELPAKVEHNGNWHRPHHPRSIEDALYCLAPLAVRQAKIAGVDVKRQGDLFAIPADPRKLSTAAIAFANPERNGRYGVSVPIEGIGSGSHNVSELVTLASLDGRTTEVYGRGYLTQPRACASAVLSAK